MRPSIFSKCFVIQNITPLTSFDSQLYARVSTDSQRRLPSLQYSLTKLSKLPSQCIFSLENKLKPDGDLIENNCSLICVVLIFTM
ncbi:uncharacterized protein DC041_0011018 [Schistosoma bovis]|uniref:Uncharacterized protein n=1 Tax=Schistosoma bovis TaxID=6184 RepID=A0A430QHA9_SCHBO|nr:uncharacterized protein DC041_0011018 [Schistosoma bovis]